MNNLQEHNLDYLAARRAQALIQAAKKDNAKPKDVKNTVTKALGVLQENGVYACFLYLLASEKKNGNPIIEAMLALLEELRIQNAGNAPVLDHIAENVTGDLHRLLLAKESLEQMLIYARYGAKAWARE